jgi:hypothetical protein
MGHRKTGAITYKVVHDKGAKTTVAAFNQTYIHGARILPSIHAAIVDSLI